MDATIDALRTFQSRLLSAIHGIPERDLATPEGNGRWSIADVIAHLADAELVNAARIRAVVAGHAPALMDYAQDAWAALHDGEPLARRLDQLWFLRRLNLSLLERLPEASLAREGHHPRLGTMSVRRLAGMLVEHQERHLAQIERIRTALGIVPSPPPHREGVVAASDGPARAVADGITVSELWRDGVRRAIRVDMAAGTKWPEVDYHFPGPEEVWVIDGVFGDGAETFPAGTFIHHPAGTSHVAETESGCSLFVFYPEG